MSTRPNPLRDAMQSVRQFPSPAVVPTQPVAEPVAAKSEPQSKPPSRVGKRSVSAHFEPVVGKQLRMLAAEHDRSVQDLIGEALNDLFRKYNKSALV